MLDKAWLEQERQQAIECKTATASISKNTKMVRSFTLTAIALGLFAVNVVQLQNDPAHTLANTSAKAAPMLKNVALPLYIELDAKTRVTCSGYSSSLMQMHPAGTILARYINKGAS